jgi:hypothetical protein
VDHQAGYSRGPKTRSTYPDRMAWGTRVYRDALGGGGGGVEGEQHGSRTNTCFRFPRFYSSTTMLPTPGRRGGHQIITEVHTPKHTSPLPKPPPTDCVSLVRTTTTRCHDLSYPPVPASSVWCL